MWTAEMNQSSSLLLHEMLEQLWKDFIDKHNPSDFEILKFQKIENLVGLSIVLTPDPL